MARDRADEDEIEITPQMITLFSGRTVSSCDFGRERREFAGWPTLGRNVVLLGVEAPEHLASSGPTMKRSLTSNEVSRWKSR
jgi:hypothetical protein